MILDLYAPNHRERRRQALAATDDHCSQCGALLGQVKLSRRKRLWHDVGQLHHPDGNPEDPRARVEILCASCHMRAHRSVDAQTGKVAPRKRGYEIIRLPFLFEQLASVGLDIRSDDTGQVRWQIDDLSGGAEHPVAALLMAVQALRDRSYS
jgi:hypothetical protein